MHIDDRSFEISVCAYCPLMCKNVDAFHRHDGTESSAPHMRNLILQKIIQEAERPKDHPPEEHLKEAADMVYKSTLGGESTAWCGQSMDIRSNALAGRADVVEHGYAPDSVTEIDERTETEHNPFGEPHQKRHDALDDERCERLAGRSGANVGLWVDSTTAYYQPEIFEAMVDILEAVDADVGMLGEDARSSGLPQYKLGLRDTSMKLADHNSAAVNEQSWDTLVVDSPEAFRAFNDFYPHWGAEVDPDVTHSSEFIYGLLVDGDLKLSKEVSQVVTYHDPYELSRHSTPIDRKEYDTSDIHAVPRDVLEAIPGVELREMRHNQEKSLSCGSGIGMREMYPDVARKVGQTVLGEAADTGASTMVVASPLCKHHFEDIVADSEDSLDLVSLPELVAAAL
jgi:Fe-S oxidoreductase